MYYHRVLNKQNQYRKVSFPWLDSQENTDYGNRDFKTGKVPKFSDGTVNEFTTPNGRTVYDGGGVTPDIKIKQTTNNCIDS